MSDDAAVPPGINVNIPNAARMYNYFLGGKDNFPADREAGDRLLSIAPEVRVLARQNRAFMGRAVRHLLTEAGIRQFIDIGTGLPSVGNVHEVAAAVDPGTRVVYVDNDPVVLTHSRALLSNNTNTITIQGDLRDPDGILADPELKDLIDFSEPVAILLVAVMHFVSDDHRPEELVARLRDAMPSGSYLVLSHVTDEEQAGTAHRGAQVYRNASSDLALRSRERILELFTGFELIDPGLVAVDAWRPDPAYPTPYDEEDMPTWVLGGVGHKP